jgi:hypothetical protein
MAKRPAKLDPKGRIWCCGCETYLAPRFFGKYPGDKPPARCKKCRSTASHAVRIKATYGITAEAYALLLEHQGGMCAICRRPSHIRRLAVDHDHQTGLVRGLLCRHDNYELLGWIKDDIEILKRAISYLEDPPLARLQRGEEWPP